MAAKKSSKKQSKSAFIRAQSNKLSAAEVVAKGKVAGIKFSPQLVYNVRGSSKPKKGTAKKSSTAKPIAVTAKVNVNKSDFVRAHAGLSPKEIVAKAKAEGIKIDAGLVYNVRGYDKSKGRTKRGATKVRATPRMGASVPRPITSTRSAEDLLKAIAAEIGLGRAIEQLQGERARVRAILRG